MLIRTYLITLLLILGTSQAFAGGLGNSCYEVKPKLKDGTNLINLYAFRQEKYEDTDYRYSEVRFQVALMAENGRANAKILALKEGLLEERNVVGVYKAEYGKTRDFQPVRKDRLLYINLKSGILHIGDKKHSIKEIREEFCN